MTHQSYIELLSEIEKGQAGTNWVTLGDINESVTQEKLEVCRELMKKGLIEFRKPLGAAVMGNRDGSRSTTERSHNNLEARMTQDGKDYLHTFRVEAQRVSHDHEPTNLPVKLLIGASTIVVGVLVYFIVN